MTDVIRSIQTSFVDPDNGGSLFVTVSEDDYQTFFRQITEDLGVAYAEVEFKANDGTLIATTLLPGEALFDGRLTGPAVSENET